ncbi:HCaRG protein-domain-containing protein [Pelagophyceae sp. CCMP2097]|nr:HCaRG protein-domain-containing protein [Pelagophyceae sp. CCMP2097]
MEQRRTLAAEARCAFEAARYDEALKALSALKARPKMAGDDVAWVEENEAHVKEVSAARPAPAEAQRPSFFPRLSSVDWRVDVTISTSHLERVLKPSVTLRLVLTDGRIKTFEMTPDQLHKLRHSVAKVLRTMQEVERHPIMRIVNG